MLPRSQRNKSFRQSISKDEVFLDLTTFAEIQHDYDECTVDRALHSATLQPSLDSSAYCFFPRSDAPGGSRHPTQGSVHSLMARVRSFVWLEAAEIITSFQLGSTINNYTGSKPTSWHAGMPGVVGAIDGTHIKIIAPSKDEDVFVNRKKVHTSTHRLFLMQLLTFLMLLQSGLGLPMICVF
ncbi:hypothetical protein N1851_003935 [Merluccius polli]|uniref:DDE Tnp4 domain-containing protein n=1 Tax=Merluccius polli TaxID=89951 RepID=A0AA47P7H6_MERPO|nr:hypothetical protein N1851_003935 [Merluccius polli]